MTRDMSDDSKGIKVNFLSTIVSPVVKLLINPDKNVIKKISQDPRLADCDNISTLKSGLLKDMGLSESAAGAVAITLGIITLSICLIIITKIMQQRRWL